MRHLLRELRPDLCEVIRSCRTNPDELAKRLLKNFRESSARMFGKFEGVLQMHRFYPVDTVEYLT